MQRVERRVVVTGIGLVTPLGIGTKQTWEAAIAGKSGVGPITRFDAKDLPCRFAGEVKGFDPAAFMDKKEARRNDLFIQFGLAATQLALVDAGLPTDSPLGERVGFVAGEGSGILVVEELEHAKKRGARIYCELTGYSATADAFHITQPSGSGAERAMKLCLDDAGLRPEDVQYVNAHGTSTPVGDIAETKAIKNSFGDWAKKGLMVSSTKSMTGHLLGAAGGVEAAFSALALYHGIVPPTINVDNQDPECDVDVVPNQDRKSV